MAILADKGRVQVRCGGCFTVAKVDASGEAAVALANAVQRAIADGWLLDERRDLCPRCRPRADETEVPTAEQLAYARQRFDARRRKALIAMVTAEHVEQVANYVVTFYPDNPESGEPTAEDVAYRILRYLADRIVEPLLAEPEVAL